MIFRLELSLISQSPSAFAKEQREKVKSSTHAFYLIVYFLIY